jgi:hypothetical protein
MRQDLWAITAYFNPVGYKRRLRNYHVFRQRLSVPLVTVELAFDGGFQLAEGDADILVQIRGGDIMWQKERLLNIGLGHVPPKCDAVAWLDCDVIFASDDWAARARRALDDVAIVHLFRERFDLCADADLAQLRCRPGEPTAYSIIHKIEAGQASPDDLVRGDSVRQLRSSLGLGWAARREVLDAHGLYDACILGGGDRVLTCAALGRFDLAARAQRMNMHGLAHYLPWARPFFEAVRGRIGSISGQVVHQWHGDLRDRRYEERYLMLADFDPFTDIARTAEGCWRWASDKPALHAAVRRYFESRNEDGDGGTGSPRGADPPGPPPPLAPR